MIFIWRCGKDAYLAVVPRKIKKADIKKLKEEGRYFDIQTKYGDKEYKKVKIDAKYEEIKNEKGPIRARLWKFRAKFFKNAITIGTGTVLGLSAAVPIIVPAEMQKSVKNNQVTYAQEIEDYNKKISKYAEEVNELNLNDAEIFMKVMDDMWENIEGYGEPQKDIQGFLELDLADENGVGVCRNMASDVAKKLNAINPKYNARLMCVDADSDGNYTVANIKQKILENEEQNINNQVENQFIEGITKEVTSYVFGNHAVTLVDIPEDNLMLILDPTNPGIGIYQKGKIEMFNSPKIDGVEYTSKHAMTSLMRIGGKQPVEEVINDLVKSYEEPKLTIEQIEEKYGLKAQNKALEKVRQEMSPRNQFVKSIQVTQNGETIMQIEKNDKEKIEQKQSEEEIIH